MWQGDLDAVNRLLIDDESQRQFIKGPVAFSAAMRKLDDAAIRRFGETEGRSVNGYPDGSAKAIADQLQIEIRGAKATVSIGKLSMQPLNLRRVEGVWRVDVSGTMANATIRRLAASTVSVAEITLEMANDVDKGVYATAKDAADAYTKRRLAVTRPSAE